MSIINDALNKAKKQQLPQGNSPLSRRWLIWISAGALCLAGFFLITNSFKGTSDKQEALSETQGSVFNIREIDFEMPFKTSDFKLTGILYDEQKPMAIINNRVLEEGALINGAELLEIQPNYVMVSYKGKEVKLKVK